MKRLAVKNEFAYEILTGPGEHGAAFAQFSTASYGHKTIRPLPKAIVR